MVEGRLTSQEEDVKEGERKRGEKEEEKNQKRCKEKY